MPDRSRQTSPEEDYRDDEERDLGQGWPYADEDSARSEADGAHGAAPAMHGGGGPTPSRRAARRAIDDDALEEEISNHLVDRDDIDEDRITVTVQHGVAKLSGSVDTAADVALAARVAAAVPGVRAVYNLLVPDGVDSHSREDAT